MQKFNVCIIGAGASGCMAAIEIAKSGNSVCLVDRFEKPAKKLLVTGNGRCNLTNTKLSSQFYNQNIDYYLSRFGFAETKKTFASFGLDICADAEGRCYPVSNSAKSVQFVLCEQLEKLGVQFISAEVFNVVKTENQKYKIFASNNVEIVANKVVLACGINDFSIGLLNSFDIDYSSFCPSLMALKTEQNTKALDGQRLSDVVVTAEVFDKIKTESGEVLFKDHGLSGICIFNLSSLFAKNKAFSGKICINLLPKWQKSQIFEKLYEKMDIFKNAQKMLLTLFSRELSAEILKRANIEKDSSSLSQKEIQNVVDIITNLEFDVKGAYSNNQVISGGVILDKLTKNLESKVNKNMFFCGEICDVDGVCGGYNLQWAWTSANIVANYLVK